MANYHTDASILLAKLVPIHSCNNIVLINCKTASDDLVYESARANHGAGRLAAEGPSSRN
jgi:hypothetical protein